jgi:hypothetical protein
MISFMIVCPMLLLRIAWSVSVGRRADWTRRNQAIQHSCQVRRFVGRSHVCSAARRLRLTSVATRFHYRAQRSGDRRALLVLAGASGDAASVPDIFRHYAVAARGVIALAYA